MKTASDPLLQPFRLGPLTLRNRVVLTSHEPAYSEGGMPTDRYRLYHVARARGGVGLTMTAGSAVVSPDSPAAFGNLHAHDDDIVPWLRRLTDDVHAEGAAVMIQLTHLGRRTTWGQGDWLPLIAPSAVREPAHRSVPKAAEIFDIDRIVRQFGEAASRVRAAGVDGIEIEAYGHLADQFLSPITNHRGDEYGGSLDNRMRFLHRVMSEVRSRAGEDSVLSLRLAVDEAIPGGVNLDEGTEVLRRLAGDGLIDLVNVVRGWIGTDAGLAEVIPMLGMASAPHLKFAGEVRRAVGIPVVHAGRIDDVATARYAISEGLLDLVGMVRAHLAEPDLVEKVTTGRLEEIRPCVGASYCLDRIYEGHEALCIHNAATGRESSLPHTVGRAALRRRVVVVGAGPAGLEAARVAGERGHDVTVLEAMPAAGGQISLATRLSRRKDLVGIVDWRLSELRRLGVVVHYNTYVEVDDVMELGTDVVIIATGGLPETPELECGADLVASGWDVLGGAVRPRGEVLLVDDAGTHASLSVAEFLIGAGAQLTLATPERTIGVEVGGLTAVPYLRAITDGHATVLLARRLVSVRRRVDGRLEAVLGSDLAEDRLVVVTDHVIVESMPVASEDLYLALVDQSRNAGQTDQAALLEGRAQGWLDGPGPELYRVGDAVAGRNIHAAVLDALRLAKDL